MGRKGKSASKSHQENHAAIDSELDNQKRAPGLFRIRLEFVVPIAIACAWWYQRDPISLHQLHRHLESHGGSLHCLRAALFEYEPGVHVRGLASTCDIPAGETLLKAPKSSILSDYTVDQDVVDLVDEDMGRRAAYARDFILAAGLLLERAKGKFSVFKDYLASLPGESDLPDNLVVWDETQLNASALVLSDVVLWRRLALQGFHNLVQSRPRLFGAASMEDCKWAMAIVISRQVHGRLIPILDHANHGAQPNAEIACSKDGCKMISTQAIPKGTEVTISYGNKPNMHLLQAYGFATRDNQISALALDATALNVTNCGSQRVALNHAADMGLPFDSEQVTCLQSAVGRCAFIRFVGEGCRRISQRLFPGETGRASYHSIAMGIPDPEQALKSLEERVPRHPSDGPLLQTLQKELQLIRRCAEKAQQELERMEATGAC